MNSIFVYWTKPYLYKNNSVKYNLKKHESLDGIDLLDFEIEFTKTSALCASKYVGKSILYTDSLGYEVFQKYDLIKYYDEVNIELLNTFNSKYDFDAGTYWTSGKTYVICNQLNPFIFLDLDFIIQDNIDEDKLSKYDLVHNQWELSRNELYVSEKKFNQLDLPYYYPNNLYPNTSFLYVNNNILLKEYWDVHEKIIMNDDVETGIDTWLLADQGILGFIARFMKLDIGCLEEYAYISYADKITDINYGGLPHKIYFGKYNHVPVNYYHIWLEKEYLRVNKNKRGSFRLTMESIRSKLNKQTLL